MGCTKRMENERKIFIQKPQTNKLNFRNFKEGKGISLE